MDGAEGPEPASGGAHDEDAFTAFVTARWSHLLRTAYLLTGDHGKAEDMVQTALMRTHRRWRRIEREDAPEVYVRRVMINLATAWWRRNRVQEHVTSELPDRPGPDQHAAFVQHDEIWGAVRNLPARMRAVLVLRYFEDMTEAQVAEALGCSVGTVKSQTHRALARLRQELDGKGDQAGGGGSRPRGGDRAPRTSHRGAPSPRPPLFAVANADPASGGGRHGGGAGHLVVGLNARRHAGGSDTAGRDAGRHSGTPGLDGRPAPRDEAGA